MITAGQMRPIVSGLRISCFLPVTVYRSTAVIAVGKSSYGGSRYIVPFLQNRRLCSSEPKKDVVTTRQKIANTMREYGTTGFVYYITVSLLSLGGFYLAIYSGVDVAGFIKSWNILPDERLSVVAGGASTFVVAYAVHKMFAPVRISIIVATVPFVVKYLRKIGLLKIKK